MYATCPANLLIIFGLQYKPRSFLIKQLSPFSVMFFSRRSKFKKLKFYLKSAVFWVITRRRVITQKTTDFINIAAEAWNQGKFYLICGLLGNYTASCGNYLPTFRDNVSVPSPRVKIPRRKSFTCPHFEFIHLFLTGVVYLTPLRERAPGTHWIWDWVGPRDGLDVLEKRNISCLFRDSSPVSPNP
jgi:hypothetical protein